VSRRFKLYIFGAGLGAMILIMASALISTAGHVQTTGGFLREKL